PAVAEVRRAVRAALVAGRRVLVACSGGADSLALAAATAFEAPRAGVAAGLVTVDHGLHADSAAQAARVAALGVELGLDPVEVVPVDVGRAGGVEAAARTARYAALDTAAAALDADVLLAHTLDDQAESVLLGLGRGSGPRSIAGMRALDGRHVRPLLQVRRRTTQEACEALGLPVWHDPANTDPDYQRVRLRHEVLPLLDDVLQGGVAAALARTADLLRDDLDALDALTAARLDLAFPPGMVVAEGEIATIPGGKARSLEVGALVDLPRAVRTRVLRAWAAAVGADVPLSAERTAALDALVTQWHGQGPIDLPGGVAVHRQDATLVACPNSTQTSTKS
ncbi:tRNA lysidine(34) synthetase TilS, partial [uncultured Jatrophihabitans sp.]|uniref:tRNA lysidine(34) synthetase TilS n=1 Tax=uncultured Jatrophihabitans sp. TaxID=1610747 RepID=UPI0035CC0969